MKKIIIQLVLIGSCIHISAQDSIKKRFELGVTLATFNSFNHSIYHSENRLPFEFCNGLFFRYSMNRFALRAQASYYQNKYSFNSFGIADGISGNGDNHSFRIGIGGQYNLLKKKDWLYAFADLNYRNISSAGTTFGGFSGGTENFTAKSNGIDTYFGLGFKLKVFKSVYLSPELFNNFYIGATNKAGTDANSGVISKSMMYNVSVNPGIRVHLTVKF